MKNGCLSIFTFLFLFSSAALAADSLSIPSIYPANITAYKLEQGLLTSCVEDIFLDKKGRFWLNSCSKTIDKESGFYQFDGYKSYPTQLYNNSKNSEASPGHIRGALSTGILFGNKTDLSGAFLFDPNTHEIQLFDCEEGEVFINMTVNVRDEIYMVTTTFTSYFIYKIHAGEKLPVAEIKVEIGSVKRMPDQVSIPIVIKGNYLWFLDRNIGFIRFDLNNNAVKKYLWSELIQQPVMLITYPMGLQMLAIENGNLLFSFNSFKEVYQFDLKSEKLSPYQPFKPFFTPDVYQSFDDILIHSDQSGNILYSFLIAGRDKSNPQQEEAIFFIYQDTTGQLYDYTPVVSEMKQVSGSQLGLIQGLFSTNFKKQISLSLSGGGLVVADLKQSNSIENYLGNMACRSITELASNKFLVNLGRIGLTELNPETGTTRSLTEQDVCFGDKRIPNLAPIIKDQNGNIWFPSEQELICYRVADKACNSYPIGFSFMKIIFLNKDQILILKKNNQLFIFDLTNEQLNPFLLKGEPVFVEGTGNEIYKSKDGTIWIATTKGLYKIDQKRGTFEKLGLANGFSNQQVMCIHEAEDGKLWLGTFGGGINIYDPKSGKVKIIDKSKGLSNNIVIGILADDEGDRWAATYHGINVLSKKGQVLTHIYEKDGLSNNECNRHSYFKASDGKLFFGTIKGLNLLDPEKLKKELLKSETFQVYLTGISYFDSELKQDVELKQSHEQLKRITLPASKRYIELNFASSSYINADKNTFIYKIERETEETDGDDYEGWTNIGANSNLTLKDLPVGEYNILVQGINHNGQKAKAPISIPVEVEEYFYKTWWFYLLCAFPFVLFGIIWFRRINSENRRLEEEVKKRTKKIEEQAEELRELDELKSRFFTNISHEFRTPLTVISGMITQIRDNPGQWLNKGLDLIHRNSTQLLSLINQILDLRKLESGAFTANLSQGDIIQYLKYVSESFISIAKNKGIKIHFLSSVAELNMDYDPEKILHIVSNLLSNAIKYSNSGDDIYIQLDCFKSAETELLQLQVKDTGQGISAEALPYIFDRFYQVEDLASQKPQGTGIGLALTKELVVLLNGSIEVESTKGEGTTFILKFPVTRNAVLNETPIEPSVKEMIRSEGKITAAENKPKALETAPDPNTNSIKKSNDETDLPVLLIVEDNQDVQQYLIACLENDYQLLVANNGQEGIDQALEDVPDLIVSDVMMPVKDGFELCETLKNDERTSHIPIILLTAKADFDSKISGLEKGADAYLPKPFEPKELLVRLNKLLELRKKLQAHYRSINHAEPPQNSEDAFILKVRSAIEENLDDEDFGILQLCKAVGLGRAQLHKKIKALTDYTPAIFIRTIRLQKAKFLLETSDLNVSEVAYEVGFKDPAYFSRVFTEEFGHPPKQTRK